MTNPRDTPVAFRDVCLVGENTLGSLCRRSFPRGGAFPGLAGLFLPVEDPGRLFGFFFVLELQTKKVIQKCSYYSHSTQCNQVGYFTADCGLNYISSKLKLKR